MKSGGAIISGMHHVNKILPACKLVNGFGGKS